MHSKREREKERDSVCERECVLTREREDRGIQGEKEIGTRDGREDEVEREKERKNVWQDGKHDKTGNCVWQWSVRWD